jgi:hypothetical protein
MPHVTSQMHLQIVLVVLSPIKWSDRIVGFEAKRTLYHVRLISDCPVVVAVQVWSQRQMCNLAINLGNNPPEALMPSGEGGAEAENT